MNRMIGTTGRTRGGRVASVGDSGRNEGYGAQAGTEGTGAREVGDVSGR